MTAAVVPFKGKTLPRFERMPAQQMAGIRALRDARLIRDASAEGDNWLNAAFFALLRAMGDDQRRLVEALLATRAAAADDKGAEQALALIRFRFGSPEHVREVSKMLIRMNADAGAFE